MLWIIFTIVGDHFRHKISSGLVKSSQPLNSGIGIKMLG
jgi:hypothetical protein